MADDNGNGGGLRCERASHSGYPNPSGALNTEARGQKHSLNIEPEHTNPIAEG